MLPEDLRFQAKNGSLGLDTSGWEVCDWDARRWVWVEGSTKLFGQDDGEAACEAFKPYADDLPENITKVTMSTDKKLEGTSTDPEWDSTPFVPYPRFTVKEVGDDAWDCLQRLELEEIDRFSPCVDLVTLKHADSSKKVVFKYAALDVSLTHMWREAFFLKRLKGCPYVLTFHKFIVDDVEPQLLGFTTEFIEGETWDHLGDEQLFRQKWLQQLLEVIDNLNLKYGIIHQDIAPRNLLIDSATDSLCLIDFNVSTEIGSELERRPRNDIDGAIYSLYEVLTKDLHFRSTVHHDHWHVEDVTTMEEWPLRVKLEPGLDVQTLRSMVMDWAKKRRETSPSLSTQIQKPLGIPPLPPPRINGVESEGAVWGWHTTLMYRRTAASGERIVRWERPPTKKLRESKQRSHSPILTSE